MLLYELTPDADEDIENIAKYTLTQWGKKQAKKYLGEMEERFLQIANREIISRKFSDVYPQVLVTRYQYHYIFYLHPEGEKPLIIAVLHERMDFVSRLKQRLT